MNVLPSLLALVSALFPGRLQLCLVPPGDAVDAAHPYDHPDQRFPGIGGGDDAPAVLAGSLVLVRENGQRRSHLTEILLGKLNVLFFLRSKLDVAQHERHVTLKESLEDDTPDE